jgi:hypothetical protein
VCTPTNGFVARTSESRSERMLWIPMRKEINEWLEQKEKYFFQKKNKNPRLKNTQSL